MDLDNNDAQPPVNTTESSVSELSASKGDYKFSFHGKAMQYLGLSLYNLLLTVLTLGLYYPWAKCAIRKFLWQETEIDGSRFEWHGTGKEMFKGFVKAYLIFGSFILIVNFGPMFLPPEMFTWVVLIVYFLFLALTPLIIHGMMRYRLSRTSLRGIHFGYRGDLNVFYKSMTRDFFLTIITLGIYSSWLQVNARKYVMKSSRFGNVSGRFEGTGGNLFWLSIGQMLLVAVTFYIYIPWAIVRFYKFYVENTTIEQNGKTYQLKTNAKGGDFLYVLLKGVLFTIITLGIGGPVASLWIHKYFTESVTLTGGFDFDGVEQTEKAYTDATADDMADILDFGF
jgi:uncharacterized membrane protein YjgN (DUF898 family)